MNRTAARPLYRGLLAWLLPLLFLAACLDTGDPPPSGSERILTVNILREEGGAGRVLVDGEPYTGPVALEGGAVARVQAVPEDAGTRVDFARCTREDPTTCTVRMDAIRKEVDVIFTGGAEPPAVHEMTVSTTGDGDGEVLVDGEPYDGPVEVEEDAAVVVRGVPADGSVVAGFTGCTTTSGDRCTVVVDGPESVTVDFRRCDEDCATVEVRTEGEGAGWIRSADGRLLCDDACDAPYAGGVVVLEAAPEIGSRFAGWSGACAGTGACEISTAAGGAAATARFERTEEPSFGPVAAGDCAVAGIGDPCTVSVGGSGSTSVRALELSLPADGGAFELDPDAGLAAPGGCRGAVGPERVAVVCEGGVALDSFSFDLGLVRRVPDTTLLAFSDISLYDADGRATAVTAGALGLPGGPR